MGGGVNTFFDVKSLILSTFSGRGEGQGSGVKGLESRVKSLESRVKGLGSRV